MKQRPLEGQASMCLGHSIKLECLRRNRTAKSAALYRDHFLPQLAKSPLQSREKKKMDRVGGKRKGEEERRKNGEGRAK